MTWGTLHLIFFKNCLPTLVSTVWLKGGLYHKMFLLLFLLLLSVEVVWVVYLSWCLWPLFLRAVWYSGAALLNVASSHEISERRLLIPRGMFLIIPGG